MPRRRILILPLSILLFLTLTLVGTYYVRKHLFERAMVASMKTNDAATIHGLLHGWPCPVNARDERGATPLHWAVDQNDLAAAAMLLDRGAEVNVFAKRPIDDRVNRGVAEDDGVLFFEATTPLHRALIYSRWDMARLLITHGADVNLPTKGCGDGFNSYSPLEMVGDADADFVEFLIRSGARVKDCGNQFHWPLAEAFKRPEVMQVLLDHGAEIERSGVDDYTTLDMAVFDNEPVAVRFLLEHGAKVDSRDNLGTPLHLAAMYGYRECAEALLAHGAKVTDKDGDGKTPLMLAIEKKNDAVADLLRKVGAKE